MDPLSNQRISGTLGSSRLPSNSIVLGNVHMLRTTQTMEIYAVSLLPPRVLKSPIDSILTNHIMDIGMNTFPQSPKSSALETIPF